MDKETSEIVKAVTTAGIIGVLGATVRALMARGESRKQVLRTFAAGVTAAILVGIIFRTSTISEFWREIMIGTFSAFISTIWPIGERFVHRYFEKKANNVVNNDLP